MVVVPLRLLRWVYVGRLVLAAGIFVAAVLKWLVADPQSTLIATLVLVVAVTYTTFSAWWTEVLRRPAGPNFMYGQALVDTVLVTAVVHVTGGASSDFAPLYILVIAAGALLLPLPGGMLIGALSSLLYFADSVWGHAGPVPPQVLVQIGLFALIALATGYLGDRLRRTGAALGEVESELRQLRLDTGDILAALDTAVVTVDEEGRLSYMNAAASALLGLRSSEWLGRPVLEVLDRQVPALGSTIARTLRTRVPVRWFEGVRDARGRQRVVGARTTVLEREGAPWATIVAQDITDGKRLEEIKRRADRLEAVAELSASLAHEIKNPLASIRSAVEQLTRGTLDEDDQQVLEKLVLIESDRLSRLLSEFIEFGRAERRDPEPLDLAALVEHAVDLARQHPDAGETLTVELETPGTPVRASADEDLLHRAVFNLVLNAIQHARSGPVRVILDTHDDWQLPAGVKVENPVRLVVQNDGPGIPSADLPRIFDPFFTRRKGGSGLGLALVHRAVQEHGGTVLVDSPPEGGARFTVYLPALRAGEAGTEAHTEGVAPGGAATPEADR